MLTDYVHGQGNTHVIAAVYGPREASNRMDALPDRAIVRVELSNASFAAGERKAKLTNDRRANEVAKLVKEAFEATILVQLFPNSQIDIFLQVTQLDGGRTAAAINAATLAVIDAGIPVRDFVCCCSAGYLDDTAVMDLNYAEECSNCPDMPVAILPNSGTRAENSLPPAEGQEISEDGSAGHDVAGGTSIAQGADGEAVVMMQLDRRLPLDLIDEMIATACDGARQIYALLKEEVRRYTAASMDSRGVIGL